MSIVQAYRRNKTYTHEFPDVTLVFEANDKGDVVCDVQDPSAVDRLLLTPTGFRLYGEQVEAPIAAILLEPVAILPVEVVDPVAILPATEDKYVLVDGDTSFDLRPLSDAQLREFAVANGVKVHPKAQGDTIRDKIVDYFK